MNFLPARTARIARTVAASFGFAALLASTSLVTGCASTARLDTPAGFATLESSDDFAYRASSAKGVVLATRTEKNELKANTEFWTESIDQKLVHAGYIKKAEKTVQARGLEGKQLRYAVDRGGREHCYWVTVFLKGDRVVLVEAAGDAQPFAKAEPEVERAIGTLRVD